MTSPTSTPTLDETVFPLCARLRAAGVPDPGALFLLGTGLGFLPGRLRARRTLELGELASECAPWSGATLHAGRLGDLSVWLLEDASGEPREDEPEAPWMRGLPVWLAAAAGAAVCVHTSAGSALGGGTLGVPGLALIRDHINFSGTTPLLGLGESKLGPLFPDLSQLHHAGLRAAARTRAAALGIAASEAIAACTLGPALETPAERAMLARLGAEVSVPNLATPLLAAGHGGLALLALVAVTDGEAGPADVRGILAAAETLQPALEDLLLALAPDVAEIARALAAEAGA